MAGMRDPQTRVIEGQTYEVTPFPAGVALRVLARLLRLVAPSLGPVGSLRAAGEALQQVVLGGLGEALGKVDGAELETLCRELASTTVVKGAQTFALDRQFDVHFQGDLAGLLEWAMFAVLVNYGPLFSALTRRPGPSSAPAAPPAA